MSVIFSSVSQNLSCVLKLRISFKHEHSGKCVLSRVHSASCCQQGPIIPIRLLKSDYVVCLQIKNSPRHLWHLQKKRVTSMTLTGGFLYIFELLSPHPFSFDTA